MTPPWNRPFCCSTSGRRSSAITTTPGSTDTTSAPTSLVKPWRSSVFLMAAALAGKAVFMRLSCRFVANARPDVMTHAGSAGGADCTRPAAMGQERHGFRRADIDACRLPGGLYGHLDLGVQLCQ